MVCREGRHKGDCFFEVKSRAVEKLKRKDQRASPLPVSGAGDNRRVNGKTDPEKVRMAAEIRKLNQQLQAKSQKDGGTSDGAPTNSDSALQTGDVEADPEAEQHESFLRLLHRGMTWQQRPTRVCANSSRPDSKGYRVSSPRLRPGRRPCGSKPCSRTSCSRNWATSARVTRSSWATQGALFNAAENLVKARTKVTDTRQRYRKLEEQLASTTQQFKALKNSPPVHP